MMFPAVRAMCLGFLLLGTAACAGDFGRPRYPWLQAMADTAAGPIEKRAGAPVSEFPLTDEEQQLRKFAENLLAPPFEREPWYQSAPPSDHKRYAAFIIEYPFRSSTARYARIIDDIRNDLDRMGPFFSAAGRVADLDRRRSKSLKFVSGLSEAELANTRARIEGNIAVITMVHDALGERVRGYRYALERLAIALPSPMAAEVDRLWNQLARRVGEIQVVAGVETPIRVVSK
jgi:hypothetical protein